MRPAPDPETPHRDPEAYLRPTHDVLAVGNALVDVLSHEEDALIEVLDLVKGTMTMVDRDQSDAIYAALGPTVESSGGSAANTVAGVASFGGRAAFIGRIADDQFGDVFSHDLAALGVTFHAKERATSGATGRCLVLVSPDAERTMCTYLGVASEITPADVLPEAVADAAVVYLEGYLWDQASAKAAFRRAAALAHGAGRRVALTLSDPSCVDRHRVDFLDLIAGDVDLLFANEDEICALYEVSDFDTALQEVRDHCEVAALTRSEKGAVIVSAGDVHVVDAHPVEKLIDTTGAGDLYAAGFLFGFTHGHDLVTSARLGALAAAEVISHMGPRPDVSLAELAEPILP